MKRLRCSFFHTARVGRNFSCHRHLHFCTEIVLCRGCDGALRQGGRAYRYSDGAVFIYQPGGLHWIENEGPGEHDCLGVMGMGAERLPEGAHGGLAEVVDPYFSALREQEGRADGLALERRDLWAGLAVLALREHFGAGQPSESVAAKARAWLEDAPEESWSVAALAQRAGVHPDYLRQLFRREHGESVMSFLIRKRMERAASLLRETDDAVNRVAEACGYESPLYFSKAFKKAFGVSPTAFRERHGKNPNDQ